METNERQLFADFKAVSDAYDDALAKSTNLTYAAQEAQAETDRLRKALYSARAIWGNEKARLDIRGK